MRVTLLKQCPGGLPRAVGGGGGGGCFGEAGGVWGCCWWWVCCREVEEDDDDDGGVGSERLLPPLPISGLDAGLKPRLPPSRERAPSAMPRRRGDNCCCRRSRTSAVSRFWRRRLSLFSQADAGRLLAPAPGRLQGRAASGNSNSGGGSRETSAALPGKPERRRAVGEEEEEEEETEEEREGRRGRRLEARTAAARLRLEAASCRAGRELSRSLGRGVRRTRTPRA